MAEAKFSENRLPDIAFWALRAAVGVIFIAHGTGKFGEGFVGFLTGCDIIGGGAVAMYGMPIGSYKINGNIVNATSKQVIPNIQISTLMLQGTDTENGFSLDTVYSDINGKFVIEWQEVPLDLTFVMKAEDIDGQENGLYLEQKASLSFSESDLSGGDGSWDQGSAEKSITIEINEQKKK